MSRHFIALGILLGVLAVAPRSSLAGDEVVSASSGSKVVAAYDDAAKVLGSADDAATAAPSPLPGHKKSAALIVRIHRYATAEQQAANALALVKQLKQNRQWRAGLKYQVTGRVILTEKQFLQRLDDMRGRAKTGRLRLAPKLVAAYKTEFPKLSAKQLAVLEQLGLPIEIAKGKNRGEICWKHEVDAKSQISCWTADGKPASQTDNPKVAGEKPAATPAKGRPAPPPPKELAPCPEGYERCGDDGNKCINLQKTPAHCGSCTTDCTFTQMDADAESAVCVRGTCVPRCRANQGICNGRCTNLDTTDNCGRCGRACPAGKACDGTKCME